MSKTKTVGDFDKVAYWKGRMQKTLTEIYGQTLAAFRSVKSDAEHLGADPHELDKTIVKLGAAFDELQGIVNALGPKKEKAGKS